MNKNNVDPVISIKFLIWGCLKAKVQRKNKMSNLFSLFTKEKKLT